MKYTIKQHKMKYTIKQLRGALSIYNEWEDDIIGQDLEFGDWLEDKIKAAKKKSSSKKKKSAKKVHYHVSSYTSEMGWFCEYDGYNKEKADETYERCKKIFPEVTFEKR